MTMTKLIPAESVPLDSLHAAFTLAFSDYLIGPFLLPPAQFPQFLARQGIDLALSRVMLDDEGAIQAFSFTAPRPGRWRLGTMGAVPAARGSGAAPKLLDDFMARARAAGLTEVELEVFAKNDRARRLYESRGFEALHELHGWQAEPLGGAALPLPAGVSLHGRDDALAWIAVEAMPRIADLPLQATPLALAASPSVLQALRTGSAQLLFAETAADTLAISSLIDWQATQADARVLIEALRAFHPQHRISVPALQRDDLGGQALREAGFERQPLHQLLMRARL